MIRYLSLAFVLLAAAPAYGQTAIKCLRPDGTQESCANRHPDPPVKCLNPDGAEVSCARRQLQGVAVTKFECAITHSNGDKIVRLIEIDGAAKQASLSTLTVPARGRGNPFTSRVSGPFPATITADKITWMRTTTVGRASSTTTYTLMRKTQTFNIHTDYNAFMDQDPWDETSQCKPG
jgi:hypothetical protein